VRNVQNQKKNLIYIRCILSSIQKKNNRFIIKVTFLHVSSKNFALKCQKNSGILGTSDGDGRPEKIGGFTRI